VCTCCVRVGVPPRPPQSPTRGEARGNPRLGWDSMAWLTAPIAWTSWASRAPTSSKALPGGGVGEDGCPTTTGAGPAVFDNPGHFVDIAVVVVTCPREIRVPLAPFAATSGSGSPSRPRARSGPAAQRPEHPHPYHDRPWPHGACAIRSLTCARSARGKPRPTSPRRI
jgi:hypothetical protein